MSDPHQAADARAAARHLVVHPLVLAEREPEMFRDIRRHEQQLDRWFTQRFGYRLQITTDTARLFKSTFVARRRPLETAANQGRAFSQREYTMLALTLAAVAAGPNVISLRDLIHEIRTGAIDADVTLTNEPADRRALVTALRWMIQHGLATEMHDRVDRYVADDSADAVLQIRPDRVALVPLPILARAESVDQVLDRGDQRDSSRSWMRAQLLEEPVVYRSDLSESEWAEFRRRLGDEAAIFGEMFGMRVEARAEGVLLVDPDGRLTDSRFPAGGTVGHAALALLDRLIATDRTAVRRAEVVEVIAELAVAHGRFWSQLAREPGRLSREVLELLEDHRLVDIDSDIDSDSDSDIDVVRLLPAAWRYSLALTTEDESEAAPVAEQGTLL